MKKAYLAPAVEVMNARVEKGFAGSGNTSGNVGKDPQNPYYGTFQRTMSAADFHNFD